MLVKDPGVIKQVSRGAKAFAEFVASDKLILFTRLYPILNNFILAFYDKKKVFVRIRCTCPLGWVEYEFCVALAMAHSED
jgi:hypothetical protein